MTQLRRLLRATMALMGLALLLSVAAPAGAQVNPTEMAVQEDALLEALSEDAMISGRVSIPDKSAGNLIKPGGRDWRAFHNNTVFNVIIWSSLIMLALLAIFFLVRGRIRLKGGFSGRRIRRYNGFERFAHWLTAIPFILLALSGLNLVVGRYVVMPLVGPGAFGTLTQWGKIAHNFLAWPFMLGLALIFLIWVKDNLPSRTDGEWLRQGGGIFSKNGSHPPARRFNPGQKMIFWAVVIGGGALSVTGFFLIFPTLAGEAENWQLAQVLHGLAGGIMTAIILAHIYLGTLGMEGTFEAMGSGEVDENWAREHHSIWAEEKLAREGGEERGRRGDRRVAPAE